MKITDVKIRKIFTEPTSRVKAIVSITLDGDFAVHDIKVIQGVDRLFVAMPNRRGAEGNYQDIVHPINQSFRGRLETAVLSAYENALKEGSDNDRT